MSINVPTIESPSVVTEIPFSTPSPTIVVEVRIAIHGDYLTVSDSGSSAHISSVGDVDDFPEPPKRLTLEECVAAKEAGAPAEQKQDAAKFEKMKESWRKALPLEFQEFSVSAESLSSAMLYVLPGVAVDQTRYALGGVFMTGNGRGGAEFVSSNIHVLYRHDVSLTAGGCRTARDSSCFPRRAVVSAAVEHPSGRLGQGA